MTQNELKERLERMEGKLDHALEELHSNRHLSGQVRSLWVVVSTSVLAVVGYLLKWSISLK